MNIIIWMIVGAAVGKLYQHEEGVSLGLLGALVSCWSVFLSGGPISIYSGNWTSTLVAGAGALLLIGLDYVLLRSEFISKLFRLRQVGSLKPVLG